MDGGLTLSYENTENIQGPPINGEIHQCWDVLSTVTHLYKEFSGLQNFYVPDHLFPEIALK